MLYRVRDIVKLEIEEYFGTRLLYFSNDQGSNPGEQLGANLEQSDMAGQDLDQMTRFGL
jgi:hypothetical protein